MPPKKVAISLGPAHLKIEFGKFKLPNGDRYEGEYQANAKTKTIMRSGKQNNRIYNWYKYNLS